MKNSQATLNKRKLQRKLFKETVDLSSFPHEIERVCKECGQLKFCSWMHSFTSKGAPEYRVRCKDCHNKYLRTRNSARRTVRTTQATRRKRLRKLKCVEYLGGKCITCGYNTCLKALNFHHLDPKYKSFSVSQKLDADWKLLKAELDKCILLCFNCHMEEHCKLDPDETQGCCTHD